MIVPGGARRAVVIGMHTMQGLQTARLLRRVGVEVIGVTTNAAHPFNRTRHCSELLVARGDPADLVATLQRLARRLDEPAVLVPCQDWAVTAISEARASLSDFRFLLPPHDVVEMLADKASFDAHARAVGLPVPESRVVRSQDDVELAAQQMTFPCVLKPASRSQAWSANTSDKAYHVNDGAALRETFDRVAAWAESFVVQQWVVGPEDNLFSVNGYFDAAGRPLATFVARKIRQWPVRTGQSSLGVECRNDDVLDLYHRLFSSVDYRGLAYLEVKQDARSGEYFLVEPNIGRPTGRSPIAEAGGVELIDTMYRDIMNEPIPDQDKRTQRYGNAKWIHLRRDLMASYAMNRSGELSLRDWARSMRGAKFFAVLDRSDPAPFFGDIAHTAGQLVRNRLRSNPSQHSRTLQHNRTQ